MAEEGKQAGLCTPLLAGQDTHQCTTETQFSLLPPGPVPLLPFWLPSGHPAAPAMPLSLPTLTCFGLLPC